MSEYIDAILDGLEDGVKIYERLLKLSKQVEKLNPQVNENEVYTDESLYKGKMKTVGDIPPQQKRPTKPRGEIIDMSLDSTGCYQSTEEESK